LQEQYGAYFILFLFVALLLLIPAVFAGYRGYALMRASYALERNGLHLRWGLRVEDIPLPEVDWVRPASDFTFDLPLPPLSYVGAILGRSQIGDLGEVEFMASDLANLVLVATSAKVYAISPADPERFMQTFQSDMELGSLAPIEAVSTMPAVYLRSVWTDPPARMLMVAGLGLALVLLAFASLSIPGRATVSLGFDSSGVPLEPVPAAQVLLLPVMNIVIYAADLLGGLYFYRKPATRPVALMLWIGGVVTPLLLAVAQVYILF
jgi:Bacterial PH domain